jgi:hypothetical protein
MNGSGGLVHQLEQTAARWPMAAAAQLDTFVKRAVSDAAAVQSRRVLASAQAELCNRALRRFLELLYDETPGGRLANISPDGRVLIAAPWSRRQYAAYGLTDHGGRVLRSIFVRQLAALPSWTRPLHLDGKQWHVNVRKYPDLPAALAWLDRWPVTPDVWLAANDAMPRRGRG